MTPAYRLSFRFEHGAGGCLWAADATSRAALGDGPLDAALHGLDGAVLQPPTLRLPDQTRRQAAAALAFFDTALNPDDPAGPSLWQAADHARFAAMARALLLRLRDDLGPAFALQDDIGPR